MRPDRLAGMACIVLAVAIATGAAGFYVPYQYEPLGPAVFAYLLAAVLCAAGGFLVARPGAGSLQIGARQLCVLLILTGYAWLFEPVGFPVTTAAAALALGLLLGLRLLRAASMALLLTMATYSLLAGILDLNLPLGWVWAGVASG